MSNIPKDVGIQKQLTEIHMDNWLQDVVFQPKWWLLIFLIIILLFIWWKAADKASLQDVCLYACLITIVALGINEYGQELTFWDYPIDIIPVFPPLSSINLICLILIYSIVYQHFKENRRFILAAAVTSAIICFILEPFLAWGGYYHLLKWKYVYGFPLYTLASICVWYITNKIRKIENSIIKAPGDNS
ncbi:MAG: hypothetical protein K0R50_556 [Eubacterium sp.]|jgi:hypothetical protein|nr:hypothetical protein [Eubacterium sp.]